MAGVGGGLGSQYGGYGGPAPGTVSPPTQVPPPQQVTNVAPNPQIQAATNTAQAQVNKTVANPTAGTNYQQLLNQYNTLSGQSPLNSQIQQLQGTLRTSQAGQSQAAKEQAARQGILGTGAAQQTQNQLGAATQQALASGTTGLQQQDILNKQALLNTGNAIAGTGVGANTAATNAAMAGVQASQVPSSVALGQGQLGLEQWQAQQNAALQNYQLQLQQQQQQLQANMALMSAASNLFT